MSHIYLKRNFIKNVNNFTGLIEKQTSEEVCVRVTGIKNNSMIVRIGTKIRVLECSEEIIKEVENVVPCRRSVKIRNNKVISCTENN